MLSNHNPKNIKKFTLVTDAWAPQMNGVVTTLSQMVKQLESIGIKVDVVHPNHYKHFPMPTYPEIPIVWSAKGLEKRILEFQPDAIHIATEGALGWRARRICLKHKLPFTSGYHTKYPEYIHQRFPIPKSWIYAVLRRFHNKAETTYVPAQSILEELKDKGFKSLAVVNRGVETDIFNPERRANLGLLPPVYLYVGRLAPEKNIEAFLDLNLEGTKVVVGKGPLLEELESQYPEAHFVGAKYAEELATYYASSDVFVFPSLTDTFGVVNIESIACGTPVAAFPVTGPKDIITPGVNGYLNDNLATAINQCLTIDRNQISGSINEFTWDGAAEQFLEHLAKIDWRRAKLSSHQRAALS
ncbi:MAG: glycosyltransferase family 1 protein [Hydrogenovibrio sp.]|nr:glycosyltransferase family 1 protein [Hydrogenovibrio sp.]